MRGVLAFIMQPVRRGAGPLIAGLLLAYFSYHIINGDRGYIAWRQVQAALVEREPQLAELVLQRQQLEREVRALRRDGIERDMLEEELRKLGYVGPRELIVMEPPTHR